MKKLAHWLTLPAICLAGVAYGYIQGHSEAYAGRYNMISAVWDGLPIPLRQLVRERLQDGELSVWDVQDIDAAMDEARIPVGWEVRDFDVEAERAKLVALTHAL